MQAELGCWVSKRVTPQMIGTVLSSEITTCPQHLAGFWKPVFLAQPYTRRGAQILPQLGVPCFVQVHGRPLSRWRRRKRSERGGIDVTCVCGVLEGEEGGETDW